MKYRLPALVFWTVAAAAATSLGLSAGPAFWRLSGETGQIVAPPSGTRAAQVMARPDLAPIIEFAPFGSAIVEQEAPAMAGETSLGLTLLGVTIANPDSASRAIIRGGDRKIQSYGVGADVTGTARLVEVNKGYVVLQVENRLETLSFPAPGAAQQPANRGPDLRNLIPRPPSTAAAAPATSNAPDAVIARYRAAIHQNAQGVMDRLGLEQTDRGYRISANASSGVRQAGFRPGDVVTTVNGQQVGDLDADRRFFDDIAASGLARVELERDGQTIFMSFPLQ